MPSNSTTSIAVNVDVDTYTASLTFGGRYEFSPQDTNVRFRSIPANVAGTGLLLVLPPNPSDGDNYQWVDADGSCSMGSIVTVIPDPGGTATIGAQNGPLLPSPLPAFTWVAANSGGRFEFDAKHNQWLLTQSSTPLFATQTNFVNIGGGGAVSPGNFAGGAAINLAAFLIKPVALGLFNVRALLNMIVAAADADVIVAVELVTNVTAFSGGTPIGPPGVAPSGRYETGTGAGQPVVVTGDAPTVIGQWSEQIATGDIGHITASIDLDVSVLKQTNPAALGQAIVITLASAAQALTGLKLNATVQESLAGLP